MREGHGSRGRRPRIAVVDDDPIFLELMQALLEEAAGYEVLTCKAWDGAYDFVKRARPDLVLLDIVLGRQEHGWGILELLALDPATRPIPLIVCSAAVPAPPDREALLARYGAGVLAKPFDVDELLGMIAALLAWPSSPASYASSLTSSSRLSTVSPL